MFLVAALLLWFSSLGFYCLARLNQDWEDVISEKICSVGSLFLGVLGIYSLALDVIIRLGYFYP